MNNYTDYYNYMNGNNNMLTTNDMKNEITIPETSKYNYDLEPYQGFIRGNMFENLYQGYKNYGIDELMPTNDREYLLLLVQIYGFAAHDLSLYLDVFPNDVKAINLRNEYMKAYKEALNNYENSFGPITEGSDLLSAHPWVWNKTKWPWEGMK